jgi:hypothetical protein
MENNSLKEIVEAITLKNEIDFVIKQVSKEKDCRRVNHIPIAKKYNLPYDSKLSMLIANLEYNPNE